MSGSTENITFIKCFFVVEDLCGEKHHVYEEEKYRDLSAAIAAYRELPSTKQKALGIENQNPFPGSLEFVRCINGKDVLSVDYTLLDAWRNNPEIQAVVGHIKQEFDL